MVEVRENVRGGDCFVHPVDLHAPQRKPDGAAVADGCAAARVGQAHHRRHSVFRLLAPGSQGRPARADQRQAGGRRHHHRRRLARAHGRSSRRSDSGLLQYPGRQPVRDAGADPVPAQAPRRPQMSRWSRPMPAASSARVPSRGGSMPISRLSTSAAGARAKLPRCGWSAKCVTRSALLVDDMIDTAGTITEAAKVVMNAGATEVFACATHPILSDPACERLNKSCHQGSDHHQHASRCAPRRRRNCSSLKVLSVGEPYSGSHPANS